MRNDASILLVLALLAACAKERETDVPLDCPAWEPEMKSLAQDQCVDCHAELGEYAGLLAVADQLPEVLADGNHAGQDVALWTRWVDDCQMSYRESRLHARGLMNPADPDFHAKLLRASNWDFDACARCHSAAAPRCETCHTEGPTACSTCHSKPDATHGAHLAAAYTCAECHKVPARWDAPGHIVDDEPPAEVVMTGLAAHGTSPSFDAASKTCSDVYCHGATVHGTEPTWGGPAQTCDTCHTRPTHTTTLPCASCHAQDRHIDGTLDLGRGCNDCHQPDPPHLAHLEADALRGPVPCAECHVVPSEVTSPGHLDAVPGAEVVLARGGAWDPAERRCDNTYCHGGFAPAWDRLDDGQAACGTCHGVPPAGHAPATINDCHTCHPGITESGGILVPGTHLDGVVDVLP